MKKLRDKIRWIKLKFWVHALERVVKINRKGYYLIYTHKFQLVSAECKNDIDVLVKNGFAVIVRKRNYWEE